MNKYFRGAAMGIALATSVATHAEPAEEPQKVGYAALAEETKMCTTQLLGLSTQDETYNKYALDLFGELLFLTENQDFIKKQCSNTPQNEKLRQEGIRTIVTLLQTPATLENVQVSDTLNRRMEVIRKIIYPKGQKDYSYAQSWGNKFHDAPMNLQEVHDVCKGITEKYLPL